MVITKPFVSHMAFQKGMGRRDSIKQRHGKKKHDSNSNKMKKEELYKTFPM